MLQPVSYSNTDGGHHITTSSNRERLAGDRVFDSTSLAEFDCVIDARSPDEFAHDHMPGALNYPVLDNDQRHQVGLLHSTDSFAARRLGATMVARNCANHVEKHMNSQPRSWKPLVYCWRGGQRSSAFVHILRQIGWPAHRLVGGYKAWRRQVVHDLDNWPVRFDFHIISGATGSGKSRLLEALAGAGAQVLHLEQMAAHKGSVLGAAPKPQPSQKMFESRIWQALREFDPRKRVYVEAESRRIGLLHVPAAVLQRMRDGTCLYVEASLAERVEFLLADYAPRLREPQWLLAQLRRLASLHGCETIKRWEELARHGEYRLLATDLLHKHYDPLYRKSLARNFPHVQQVLHTEDLSPAGISQLAWRVLECSNRPSNKLASAVESNV